MDGKNELRLCPGEMINAMQLYVDNLMPNKREICVRSVKQIRDTCGTFIIEIGKNENK